MTNTNCSKCDHPMKYHDYLGMCSIPMKDENHPFGCNRECEVRTTKGAKS